MNTTTSNGARETPSGRPEIAWAVPLLFSAASWAVLFVALPPGRQEFPLGDDWAFARSTFALWRGEGVHYYRWASMPQLGQWLWAWPFVRIFGESHVALRLSTILLSWIGLAAFYDLVHQEGKLAAGRATFLTTCLALNPLFFLLGGTYMTDVPALSLSLLALALYGRVLAGSQWPLLVAAATVAVLAGITRQNAIVVPLTAAVLLLWRRPPGWTHPRWLLAIGVPVAATLAADHWFRSRPDIIAKSASFPPWDRIGLFPFFVVHALGLAVLPVLLGYPFRGRSRMMFGLFLVLLGAAGAYVVLGPPSRADRLFPYLGNTLSPYGQFGNQSVVVGERTVLMGVGTRLTLTILGCAGAAGLLVRVGRVARNVGLADMLPVFTVLHFLLMLIAVSVFDRYLLVLLPGALYVTAVAGAEAAAWRWRTGVVALAGSVLLSVGLMHDWLAWNSARWELGRRALSAGHRPSDIEGGFEWDGWYSPDGATGNRVSRPWPLKVPLFVPGLTGRLALSFSVLPGTVALDEEPYWSWLIPGRRAFYLIEPTTESGEGD